jgi:class 3 adenylate cyclase
VINRSYETVVLFADVSGFTALSEMLASKGGRDGAEQLAKHVSLSAAFACRNITDQSDIIAQFVL